MVNSPRYLLILLCGCIVAGNTVLRSSTWVPLRLATRTNYINVNRDHEFEDLSWDAMTNQALSYAFITEICRGNYKAYRLLGEHIYNILVYIVHKVEIVYR